MHRVHTQSEYAAWVTRIQAKPASEREFVRSFVFYSIVSSKFIFLFFLCHSWMVCECVCVAFFVQSSMPINVSRENPTLGPCHSCHSGTFCAHIRIHIRRAIGEQRVYVCVCALRNNNLHYEALLLSTWFYGWWSPCGIIRCVAKIHLFFRICAVEAHPRWEKRWIRTHTSMLSHWQHDLFNGFNF